jgi:hypothetical protein
MAAVRNFPDAIDAFKASGALGPGVIDVIYVGAWTSGPGDEQGHAVVSHNGTIFRPGVVTSYDGDQAGFHWGLDKTDLWAAKVASVQMLDGWNGDHPMSKGRVPG